MTDPVLDRPSGVAALPMAEQGDQPDVEVISAPCVYCRTPRSSAATGVNSPALVVAAVPDGPSARSVRDVIASVLLDRAVPVVPVTCLVCRLDFATFADPTEAAYFSRVHNEMHHGAWRWHYQL